MLGFKDVNVYVEGKGIIKTSLQIENGLFSSFDDAEDLSSIDDNLIIVPGFIDEHIHGCNGSDAMDARREDLATIASSLPQDGVTSFLATTMTMEEGAILKALLNIKEYMANPVPGARVLGVHLEGPFISKVFAGAQDPKNIAPLSVELFKKYNEASGNNIKLVTFAYEENGDALLEHLINHNIVASLGHSNCPGDLALKGMEKGIKCTTHTYNAMRGLHHRDIGVVGAAMLNESVSCELICDLHHVSKDAVKLLYKNKGKDKIILITDSMEARFLPNGVYSLGGQKVNVKDGVATLDDGTLAGSTLRMNEALRNFKLSTGCTFEEVIDMASKNPAINLGIYDKYGSITLGKHADFVILDKDFNIYETYVDGKRVYKKR